MEKTEKRNEIISATLELLVAHGFHGTPMKLISQNSKIAIDTIYRFFKSKDDLITESFACLQRQMLASIISEYPEGESIRDQFLHISKSIIKYFIESPTEFRFHEQFYSSPYGASCNRERLLGNIEINIISELFDEGRKQQIIKDLPLPVLIALTFGPLIHICRSHIQKYCVLDDQLLKSAVDACWDSIKR
ncbi:MAG TPA: TetR/AcrR family transcriptional regulator [Desulfuromonadaceae bacterium]